MKKVLLNQAFPHFNEPLKNELDQKGVLRLYKRNEIIVQQGEALPSTFIILTGSVKVYRENKSSKKFIITFLKQSNAFAVSVSDDSAGNQKTSLMSFMATEPSYLLLLNYVDKDAMARQHDQWYKYILYTSVMYYEFYLDLIDNIAFKTLDERIVHFLRRMGQVNDAAIVAVSHQEIADGLNSSREAVSRILKKLEAAGKIRLSHSSIELLNVL